MRIGRWRRDGDQNTVRGVTVLSTLVVLAVLGLGVLNAMTRDCIEANERPGLANHEPHPTAQRFIDLLFPRTRPRTG